MTRIVSSCISALFIFCIALLCASAPLFSYAQITSSQDVLSVSVNPQTPGAGEKTTITVSTSYFDAGTANFIWTINGAPVISSGAGARTITFTMGPVGKATSIGLTIRPRSGEPISRMFTFRPGGVTLLWEANTYVPPFYSGKALYSAGSSIKVLAITNIVDTAGRPVDASDLTFKWKINDVAFADRSGAGKNVLELTGHALGGPEQVLVDVLRRDGSKAGQGFVEIADTDPKILFYKKDPLRGTLYATALINQATLDDTETTIVAEPFYMSGTSRNQKSFTYEWLINDKPIAPQGKDPAVLTLRQTSAQTGSANLQFAIQNTDSSRLLQQASAALMLILGGAKTDFFGI